MAKTIKMCDMSAEIAAKVFQWLNGDNVQLKKTNVGMIIVTDVEPMNLVYPEGWYYAKGNFRNKGTSTTGAYGEIYMENSEGVYWDDIAKYCTL